MQNRIDKCFNTLKNKNKKALITFLTAGDPEYELSLDIIKALPEAGADIIEIGMPFTDPMADGPIIQASSQRSLKSGHTMNKTFDLVYNFRAHNTETPIILMGYYNPIYNFGAENFLDKAKQLGVDGLIVVDLPPEEDNELCDLAIVRGISFIRLATPTTDKKRLKKVLQKTSGFLYYVSIAGITGSKKPDLSIVKDAVINIKQSTNIPIGVGFGIKSKNDIVKILDFADAVIVGSVLVNLIANDGPASDVKKQVIRKVEEFASIM
mgnify:FL=1